MTSIDEAMSDAPDVAGLVERTTQLAVLHRAARQAATGRARAVLITGPAGIGKSALAGTAVEALGPPWSVRTIHTFHADRSFDAPFGVLGGRVPFGADPVDGLVAVVAASCRRESEAGPLAVVLEDLHAIDPVAVAVLPRLLDALADRRVLLLVTTRPTPLEHSALRTRAMDHFVGHPAVESLTLEPLSVHGIAALIAAGPPADERVSLTAQQVLERTGGVPFLVHAILHGAQYDDEVPWTVAAFVDDQLGHVGPPARHCAELLAVAAGELPLSSHGGPVDGPSAEALVAAGLAARGETDGLPVLRLRHSLVIDAVRETLTPQQRAARHRQLAEWLDNTDDPPLAELARHWQAAGEGRRAAGPAIRAADRLLRAAANDTATDLYAIAIDAGGGDGAERDDALLERAATAAGNAGRYELAARWGLAATRARRSAPRPWQLGGGWVSPLIAQAATGAESDAEAVAHFDLACQALALGDLDRAAALAEEAVERAHTTGDPVSLCNAATVLMLAGRDRRAAHVLDGVIADTITHDPVIASVAQARLAKLVLARGDVAAAVDGNDRAARWAHEAGNVNLGQSIEFSCGFLAAWSGELADAERWAQRIEASSDPLNAVFSRVIRVAAQQERGDLTTSGRGLAALVPTVRALSVPFFSIPVLTMAARQHLMAGELSAARAVLTELAIVDMGAHHEFSNEQVMCLAVLAALEHDTAELEAAASRAAQRFAVGPDLPDRRAITVFIEALGTAEPGVAAARMRLAAQWWEQTPRWGYAADAWVAASVREPTASCRHADRERARDIADRYGLERIAWWLAVTAPAGPAGAAVLTSRELDVASAAARGLSNREIAALFGLSERTVRNYLSTVFAKLAITRREQLAAFRSQLG